MRTLLYIVILALLFLAPVERLDVAKLEPVQTVAIRVEDDSVILETDTNNRGVGTDIANALSDLEDSTPGVIYLDTAEYLLVSEDATIYLDALREYFSPSVRISLWDGVSSVEGAAQYLAVRDDLVKLRDWQDEK